MKRAAHHIIRQFSQATFSDRKITKNIYEEVIKSQNMYYLQKNMLNKYLDTVSASVEITCWKTTIIELFQSGMLIKYECMVLAPVGGVGDYPFILVWEGYLNSDTKNRRIENMDLKFEYANVLEICFIQTTVWNAPKKFKMI